MNTETGEIRDLKDIKDLSPAERGKWVEVKRDLTKHEALKRQIGLYSPCACGSGQKFKFCCYTKPRTT